jgi:hypothetical protein
MNCLYKGYERGVSHQRNKSHARMIIATNTNKSKSFFIVSSNFACKVKGVRFKVKGLRSGPPLTKLTYFDSSQNHSVFFTSSLITR